MKHSVFCHQCCATVGLISMLLMMMMLLLQSPKLSWGTLEYHQLIRINLENAIKMCGCVMWWLGGIVKWSSRTWKDNTCSHCRSACWLQCHWDECQVISLWVTIMSLFVTTFLLARNSIYAIVCYMPSPVCPSIWLSVCPSHGWISQRWLKLGSCNLHHKVAPWL